MALSAASRGRARQANDQAACRLAAAEALSWGLLWLYRRAAQGPRLFVLADDPSSPCVAQRRLRPFEASYHFDDQWL